MICMVWFLKMQVESIRFFIIIGPDSFMSNEVRQGLKKILLAREFPYQFLFFKFLFLG